MSPLFDDTLTRELFCPISRERCLADNVTNYGTFALKNFCSRERMFCVWNFRSREQKCLGIFAPGSENIAELSLSISHTTEQKKGTNSLMFKASAS